MTITTVEARVPADKQARLKQAFREQSRQAPTQLKETMLTQSSSDPEVWQTIGFWPSRQALDDYRKTVDVPGAILIFRAAGVEPAVSIQEVIDQQGDWQ